MAESSGFHTTNAAPAGHQVTEYTEALLGQAMTIIAACHGSNGVAPAYLNILVPSDGGANTLNVATGGAMVDGCWYYNSAVQAVTIPNAPGGTVRYDRVTLHHTGTPTFTVVLTVNTGDAVNPPATPAGDISIATVMVTDAGVLTVTDARDFAKISWTELDNTTISVLGRVVPAIGNIGAIAAATNDRVLGRRADALTFAQVATAEIADLAVTSGKIGADAVIAGKIADGAVDVTASLVNGIVTPAKTSFMNSNGATAGIYTGKVLANGTAVRLPAAWTSGYAPNVYTITHNLGSTDYTICVTSYDGVFIGGCALNANDVDVEFQTHAGASTTTLFSFIIIKY